jgi:hypothetical protein
MAVVKLLEVAVIVIVLLVLAIVAWPYVNVLLLPGTALYSGKHRQFFMDCASLRPGTPSAAVLEIMRGYVASTNGEHVDGPAMLSVRPEPDPSLAPAGADASLRILPTKTDPADWCICLFKHDRLVKTVISPD